METSFKDPSFTDSTNAPHNASNMIRKTNSLAKKITSLYSMVASLSVDCKMPFLYFKLNVKVYFAI